MAKDTYRVSANAKAVPRNAQSPLNPKIRVGIGGEITLKREGQQDEILREATDDEYMHWARENTIPHLVELMKGKE